MPASGHHEPAPGTPPQGAGAAGTGAPAGPDDDGDTTDDDFLALIAHFDEEPGERAWPEAEDIATSELPDSTAMPPAGPGPAPAATGTGPTAPGGGRFADDLAGNPLDDLGDGAPGEFEPDSMDEPDDDADEGHYTPPPPPPAPRMRPATRWALGSIALGVAILFVPAIFGFDRDGPHDMVGVFLILGGVGALVARMGERRPTDSDGPDDGAIV